MKISVVICAALLSIVGPGDPTRGLDTDSANQVVQGCRSAIAEKAGDMFRQGFCYGAVEALVITRSDICPPHGTTRSQAVRIVVQYIDSHPAQSAESFFGLAWQALRSNWPCQH